MACYRTLQLSLVMLLLAQTAANIILKNQQVVIMDMETEDQLPYKLSFGDHRATFEDWKAGHASIYGDNWKEAERFSIFSDNLAKIERHNWLYHTNKSTFYMGINQFSAMTHDEYLRYNHLGKYSSKQRTEPPFNCLDLNDNLDGDAHEDIPAAVNWTDKGYVTPVKDQKNCGSCWAFSATGAAEGAYFKSHKKLVSFSEQQLVDCCDVEGCQGCDSGDPIPAYIYIHNAHGLNSEQTYPYEHMTESCRVIKNKTIGQLTKCYMVTPSGDEAALKRACAKNGPISVGIDSSLWSFAHYKGGVYYDPRCSNDPENLHHAVLVTGYGTTENNQDYWIVKNSWGTKTWGQGGYGLMIRNQDNACGIADHATFPVYK